MEMRVREAPEQAAPLCLLRQGRTALARPTVLAQQALTRPAKPARSLGSLLVDSGERLQAYVQPYLFDFLPVRESGAFEGLGPTELLPADLRCAEVGIA